jgi:predicted GNAT family acetyltransferase
VPGGARLATAVDVELVAGWAVAFALETQHGLAVGFDAPHWARTAIVHSSVWLWLDRDGSPVAMAARRPPAAGVSRIGPVYTPPEHRRHGYGSAVTARAAFDILDQSAVAVLYTDLGNPTSNKIYRDLGFRPVADRLSVSFG